jgi:hypothetical protein
MNGTNDCGSMVGALFAGVLTVGVGLDAASLSGTLRDAKTLNPVHLSTFVLAFAPDSNATDGLRLLAKARPSLHRNKHRPGAHRPTRPALRPRRAVPL